MGKGVRVRVVEGERKGGGRRTEKGVVGKGEGGG